MAPSNLNISKNNDAWILHREEITTLKDGSCNLYVLLEAFGGHCFGMETSVELPSAVKITSLIKGAFAKTGTWPKKILILINDPYVETLQVICAGLKIEFQALSGKDLEPFVDPLRNSFQGFRQSSSDTDKKEMAAFIPETYGPCPCASGEKYKFCCQKAFKSIINAMCEAQDGHLEPALHYMKEAEEKVGRTAEIVCRYAVCWSFFDKNKSIELLNETKRLNPNHPRLNFLLGINFVAEKNYVKAIEHYQKAITNYPPASKFHLNESYNNLGTAYYKSGDFKGAKDAWEKALVMLPSDKMVKENLFECIYDNPDMPSEMREINPFIKKYLKI